MFVWRWEEASFGGRKHQSPRHDENPSEHPQGLSQKQLNFNCLIKRETFISHKWPIKRFQSELPRAEPRFSLPALLSCRSPSGERGRLLQPCWAAAGLAPQPRPSPARRVARASAEPASGEQLRCLPCRLEGSAGNVSG